MIHTLKDAIEVRNTRGDVVKTITELKLRERLTVGDAEELRASSVTDPTLKEMLSVIGRLSGHDVSELRGMGLEDLGDIWGAIRNFSSTGRKTSASPSP